jgi:hypothetical protein
LEQRLLPLSSVDRGYDMKKYITILSILVGVLLIISTLGFINEHNLRRQYQNVLTYSMNITITDNMAINETLRALNESISQKKLYCGSNRYRPTEFRQRYSNAALEIQKVYSTYISFYSNNEKKYSHVNNNTSALLMSYSNYFYHAYQTMPVVTETNGDEYIILEGDILKRTEMIAQKTSDINKIINDVYTDIGVNKNDKWKVIIERLSEFTPKSIN